MAGSQNAVGDVGSSGPPTDRLTKRVLQVSDAMGALIEYWGFKAVHGRAWALLAIRREPMSQSEVAEYLGVSRSLISGVMSELSEYGLVETTSDHRNAPYTAVMDIWPAIKDVLRSREWMLLEQGRLALEAAIEEAEMVAEEEGPGLYDPARMRLLLAMTELTQALLKILFALGIPRSIDNANEWLKKASSLVTYFRQATRSQSGRV
jgi:DNA-binding transcriptional regulator GbsR (MarR family)